MSIPNYTPAPPRMHHRRRESVATRPPALPLNLLSAVVVDFSGDATVELVFDNTEDDPIVNIDSTVGTNWFAKIEDNGFGGNTPLTQSAYNVVILTMGFQGASFGPNAISYAAMPADIVTASGRVLAAMENFPLGGP